MCTIFGLAIENPAAVTALMTNTAQFDVGVSATNATLSPALTTETTVTVSRFGNTVELQMPAVPSFNNGTVAGNAIIVYTFPASAAQFFPPVQKSQKVPYVLTSAPGPNNIHDAVVTLTANTTPTLTMTAEFLDSNVLLSSGGFFLPGIVSLLYNVSV